MAMVAWDPITPIIILHVNDLKTGNPVLLRRPMCPDLTGNAVDRMPSELIVLKMNETHTGSPKGGAPVEIITQPND
jgi:hypothetical protein